MMASVLFLQPIARPYSCDGEMWCLFPDVYVIVQHASLYTTQRLLRFEALSGLECPPSD